MGIYLFDFKRLLDDANKIDSIDERIMFLRKELKDFNQMDYHSRALDMFGYKDNIEEEIKYLSYLRTQPKQENPYLKGFQSKLTQDQILLLYNELKGNYIDLNTNLDHFKAIFKDETLPQGFKPIKRLKEFTVVLCAYFVSELFQKENQSDYWKIAENCFDAKNLKQSLNNAFQFNPNQKPKGYEKIDTILKNLYHPLQ